MISKLKTLPVAVQQYILLTGNYWFFTLTDGALRMLVVLHFHQLGYSPFAIASLFLFYEIFGIVTNLVGGWLGARIGLNKTMNIGLGIQIIALLMLAAPSGYLTVAWVMLAQALSGIAKDLNKMSAKSSIKHLVKKDQSDQLYKWVALLTGSKNTLKGVGFFLGGLLLMVFGFQQAMLIMATVLSAILSLSLLLLNNNQPSRFKPKFSQLLSKSQSIHLLAGARLFLFGARDIWFVVALPVYLASAFDWHHWQVGSFLAIWVILYGIVQSIAPKITRQQSQNPLSALVSWSFGLTLVCALITISTYLNWQPQASIIIGLLLFGAIFALNSSLHSFLIVHFAETEHTSMDVGFYYMANACGRLIGTLLSGSLFQAYGLTVCLIASTAFLLLASIISTKLNSVQK